MKSEMMVWHLVRMIKFLVELTMERILHADPLVEQWLSENAIYALGILPLGVLLVMVFGVWWAVIEVWWKLVEGIRGTGRG